MKTMIRRAALALCVLGAAGCYTREPLGRVVPAPATQIVATVTDSGAVIMGNTIGPGAMEVEGVVSQVDDAAWTLHLLRVFHRDGRDVAWNREAIRFPAGALSEASVVQLDRRKSWIVAGGITAGVLLIGTIIGSALGGEAEDRNGGPPPPAN